MEIEQSVALFFFPKPGFDAKLCLYLLAILVLLLTIHLTLNRVEVLVVICINPLNEGLALGQADVLKAGLLLSISRRFTLWSYRLNAVALLYGCRYIIGIQKGFEIGTRGFFHRYQSWFLLLLLLLLLLMRLQYLFCQLSPLVILVLWLFLPLPTRRRLLRCLVSRRIFALVILSGILLHLPGTIFSNLNQIKILQQINPAVIYAFHHDMLLVISYVFLEGHNRRCVMISRVSGSAADLRKLVRIEIIWV